MTMTVEELIEELQNMPKQAEVLVYHCRDCGGDEIYNAVLLDGKKYVMLNG